MVVDLRPEAPAVAVLELSALQRFVGNEVRAVVAAVGFELVVSGIVVFAGDVAATVAVLPAVATAVVLVLLPVVFFVPRFPVEVLAVIHIVDDADPAVRVVDADAVASASRVPAPAVRSSGDAIAATGAAEIHVPDVAFAVHGVVRVVGVAWAAGAVGAVPHGQTVLPYKDYYRQVEEMDSSASLNYAVAGFAPQSAFFAIEFVAEFRLGSPREKPERRYFQ